MALCEYCATAARADLPQRHAAAGPRRDLPGTRTALHDSGACRAASRRQPTVAREVERLAEAGLLETELRSGRRSVWANTTSPIFVDLHSILLRTIGPKSVLEDQLRGLRGAERALIYGSWARRYHGESGPLPQDVDLMIIGTGDVGKARAAADGASRALSRDVNVSVLTPAEWNQAMSGFVRSLRAQPVVELNLAPR